MIFVTLGSQKFQFNRLLIEIDKLVDDKKITEEVFAQIGYSDYKPRNYKYKEFLDRDEFAKIMRKCDKVITHGGTGAIIGAVKNNKKVIAIPRLAKYDEHVDNHQLQIVNQFKKTDIIIAIEEVDNIIDALRELENKEMQKYISNTHNIVAEIDKYINNES